MNIITTGIEGLVVIEPKVFGDDRGYFFESFNEREFTEKVGESVRLRVRAYPEADFADAVYQWSVSDPRRLTITVSEDTRTCTVLCLKHEHGPVTLTVSCNGVEKQLAVYTRK
jgi:hypothetical protein